MMQKYQKQLLICFKLSLSILCLVVFYSFITAPYTGDIQVFMAAANQVKYNTGNGLMRIFEAWELKGIANRIVIYIVYRLTKVFVNYADIVAFEICSKVIYGIFILILIGVSMAILPAESTKKKILFGLVIYFSIFATYTAVQMQAEMTIAVLAFFAFSCIVNENKKMVIIGGIAGSLFFFFKSVFILLFFVALAGAYVYNSNIKRSTIVLSVGSMIISEILLVIAVKVIYPQEFIDMSNAAEFQSTLFSSGSNVPLITICTNFLHNFTQSCVAIPALLAFCICTIGLIAECAVKKKYGKIVAIIVSWIIPIDIIVASNTYFIYHYFLLMIPGMICIIAYLSRKHIVSGL